MFWNLITNIFTQEKDRQQIEILSRLSVITEISPTVRDFSRTKRQILRVNTRSDEN